MTRTFSERDSLEPQETVRRDSRIAISIRGHQCMSFVNNFDKLKPLCLI